MPHLLDPARAVAGAGMTLLAAASISLLPLRRTGHRFAVVLAALAFGAGEWGALWILRSGGTVEMEGVWSLPFGSLIFRLDPLSALFLVPLFLVALLCFVYSRGYLPAESGREGVMNTFFLGIFSSAMVFLLISANAVFFLMMWEIMALSAWFLLSTAARDAEVRRAATVYLFATHAGTMALFVMFSLLAGSSGTFVIQRHGTFSPSPETGAAVLLLALVGFGGKAGLMPLHFWLPGAHANAPSHVSAMMSGLMLKMGIYGILRTAGLFSSLPPWFGWTILAVGGCSAVSGIAVAVRQGDMKRLLAWSSVENVGIVATGLGIGFVGVSEGDGTIALLGFTGGLIHVLNHALFKPLMFLGSGVIIHGTGTRRIDRLGGLARTMPRTALFMLAGSLAISGLPPFNGFIGELFLYLASFRHGMTSPLPFMIIVAPLLALVGGGAVIAFVKLYGIMFLGAPRSPEASGSHEGGGTMLVPMGILAILCTAIGLFPGGILAVASPAAAQLAGRVEPLRAVDAVPLGWIGMMNLFLVAAVLVVTLLVRRRLVASGWETSRTWGCGWLSPTCRMQYTGSSFGETAVGLVGTFTTEKSDNPVHPLVFPPPARFLSPLREIVVDRILTPLFTGAGTGFSYVRRLQHGKLHIYMLYIFVTLFIIMLAGHP